MSGIWISSTVGVYAGVGSRQTPPEVCALMTLMAAKLGERGWILRSGGARGADTAFAAGATRKEVFRPSGPIPQTALDSVAHYHPAPWRLNACTWRLHARNAQIVLGANLDDPVCFVLCWTPGGSGSGGTGQALRIARAHGIPVYDIGLPGNESAVRQALGV